MRSGHLSLTPGLLGAILVAFADCGCASGSGAQEAAAADEAPEVIDASNLPKPHFRTDGSKVLYLMVTISNGSVTDVAEADAASANLVVTFKHRDKSRTMVEIASKLEVPLKWDLHISPDDQRYIYTSSCPRPPVEHEFASFEEWPHPVPWLAISNFRVPADGPLRCS